MEGRVDLPKYENACRTMENFVPLPHGPVTRRPGTKYVGETETMSEVSRLIPFRFSTTQAYVLEFGNLYMRVYKDRGRVLETAVNISDITKANPGVVTTSTSHGYENGDLVYIASVGGMTEVNGRYFTVAGKTSDTFQLSGVNTLGYTTYTTGGTVARVYTLTTPYTAAQVSAIKFTQSADTLYLCHPSHAPRKLTRTGHSAWTITTINFRPVPLKEDSIEPDTTLTPAATTGIGITFTAAAAAFISGDVHREITSGSARAVITGYTSTTVVTCDIISDFASTDAIASGNWTIIGSPYGEMTLTQTGPVGGNINLLTTGSGTIDKAAGTPIGNMTSFGGLAASFDGNTTQTAVQGSNKEGSLTGYIGKDWGAGNAKVIAQAKAYSPSDYGWTTGGTCTLTLQVSNDNFVSDIHDIGTASPTNAANQIGTIVSSDTSTAYRYVRVKIVGSAGGPNCHNVEIEFFDVIGGSTFRAADVGKYVAVNNGLVLITEYISGEQVKGQIIKELDSTDATTGWTLRIGMWDATQGWPYAVTFKDERLIFGGSDSFPQYIWGSPVGDYEKFPGGTDDADSFAFEIAAREVNVIRWLEPGKNLVAGTAGAEWVISGGGDDSPITPTNVNVKQHTANGSANIMALTANRSILFIQEHGEKLMEFTYDFESDGYVAPDLTLLAEHITAGGLTALAYQKTPYSIVWGVRADGMLVGMTYLREQDIIAWHQHPLGGTNTEVESIAVIPGSTADELWMIVKRTINGGTVRYVEYMTDFFDGGDQEDAFYVDSGLTYDSDETPTITGLDHLEGETVKVYGDGLTQADKVVSSGSITIATAAKVVQVGLAYCSDLELMRYAPPVELGKFQGSIKRIVKLVLRLYETLSCQFGPDTSNLDSIDSTELTESLYTGDYEVGFPGGYETPGRVFIRQLNPEPMTITAIVRKATVGRN